MGTLEIRHVNYVLEISINRDSPENRLSDDMYRELNRVFREASSNTDVRVIVLGGQPFCFTTTDDLVEMMQHPPEDEDAAVYRFLKTIIDYPKPLVCAINGPAIGIGTTICMHADLVYCGESAEFQLPFARLGLVPEFAASYLLPLITSHARAFELLVLGETFDARTACQLGLVNEVFRDESYLRAAMQKAVMLSELPPEAVLQSKKLLKSHFVNRSLQALEQEARELNRRLRSEETRAVLTRHIKGEKNSQ